LTDSKRTRSIANAKRGNTVLLQGTCRLTPLVSALKHQKMSVVLKTYKRIPPTSSDCALDQAAAQSKAQKTPAAAAALLPTDPQAGPRQATVTQGVAGTAAAAAAR
jgi:hypothetical protein